MDTNQVNVLPSGSTNPVIITDNFEDDKLQICPACNSTLKLFYINLEEKLLMCDNLSCAFPFGSPNLHYYKIDPDSANEEVISIRSLLSPGSGNSSGSNISNNDWNEIDKLSKAMADLEEAPCSPVPPLVEKMDDKDIEKINKEKLREEVIRKDIQRIKELNKQLFQPEADTISNNKFLHNIVRMQERSGVQVLKEHELKKCKKVLASNRLGELKIDIDTASNSIPQIQIELSSTNDNK